MSDNTDRKAVIRYRPIVDTNGDAGMVPCATGFWVTIDDYRDILAAKDQAEAENKALREGRGVMPLPRCQNGGWTLPMDLISDLDREVQADGWDGCTAEVTEIIALSVERRILSALSPAPVSVSMLERAYLAGFNASGEGWNGEYPYQDNGASPTTDAKWIETRDTALRALSEGEG